VVLDGVVVSVALIIVMFVSLFFLLSSALDTLGILLPGDFLEKIVLNMIWRMLFAISRLD